MEIVGAVGVLIYVATSAVLVSRLVTFPFEACAWLSRGDALVEADDPLELTRHHPREEDHPVVVLALRCLRGSQAARALRRLDVRSVLNMADLRTRETTRGGEYDGGLGELAPVARVNGSGH